jgi:hypothetical protein
MKSDEKRPRVLAFTGMTYRDVHTETQLADQGVLNLLACYLCKRRLGDESCVVSDGNVRLDELGFFALTFASGPKKDKKNYRFTLCRECRTLLEVFAKAFGKGKDSAELISDIQVGPTETNTRKFP